MRIVTKESYQMNRMKELVYKLNEASKAYYQEDREIISNYEYDKLYDELASIEEETGTILANSPTIHVGYEALEELPKEPHDSIMLSLDKTKEVSVLADFAGNRKTLISWKMDGLTIVLTYRDGTLFKAVTRGNGVVGEVVTNNAKVFQNIPLSIAYKGELVIRGEAIITYSDFKYINAQIDDVDAKYKNPRNLCSGSVRQLNNEITAKRKVHFFAFGLVSATNIEFHNSREEQFKWLSSQGFDVVEYKVATKENIEEVVDCFANKIIKNDFPSDGLVALYDDISYGESLGNTAKFPRNAFAFKWADEIKETKLVDIEWSPSRTGLINPVAIFEPVELEGTTVSRASVHNVSILKDLELGIGDEIQVYKANMIIPQVAENNTRSGNVKIPKVCPVCGEEAKVQRVNEIESLYCMNPECQAKKIKAFTLFVSRNALNIDGLSEATLEKFIAAGFIKDFGDVFELEKYKEEIIAIEGFGEKSYNNLIESIEKARDTTLPKVLYSLGIPSIGLANAKVVCKEFGYNLEKIRYANEETLSEIEGIGPVIAKSFVSYFTREENNYQLDHLLSHLHLEEVQTASVQKFVNMNFVITGSVEHYKNRNELKEVIESLGGKVTGSVTSKTNYLINNDTTSNSSKNKKAKDLGVPIISEVEFEKMCP